jgi:NADH dehydrogenase
VPLAANVAHAAAVARAVEGAEFVVNLVGILAEQRHGDFQRVQADGAGAVAAAATAAGVARLVHVSAIGADPASDSLYGRSKGQGEQAVRAGFPDATILRPSIVFGAEDQFFNRFAAMAALSPFMPVIAGATRLQPVFVGDVADAAMAALTRLEAGGRIYELGGPQVFTMRELLVWILHTTNRHRRLVTMPGWLAELQAAVLEKLPGKLLTRDQLRMLAKDNVVGQGVLSLAELGIQPTPADLVVPRYLGRFRPGGGRKEIYATP